MNDYIFKTVRAADALTTSYVAGTILDLSAKYNTAVLLVDFTKQSLTTAEVKVEFSPDGTNWYQESDSTPSSGVISEALAEHQFSATGKYRIPLYVYDRFMRISAKGTGTVTNSSMKIDVVLAVA